MAEKNVTWAAALEMIQAVPQRLNISAIGPCHSALRSMPKRAGSMLPWKVLYTNGPAVVSITAPSGSHTNVLSRPALEYNSAPKKE